MDFIEEFNFGYESIKHYLEKVHIFAFIKETEEVLPTDEHNGGIHIYHNEFFVAIYMNKINHFECSVVINDDVLAFTIIDSGDLLENFLSALSLEFIKI